MRLIASAHLGRVLEGEKLIYILIMLVEEEREPVYWLRPAKV